MTKSQNNSYFNLLETLQNNYHGNLEGSTGEMISVMNNTIWVEEDGTYTLHTQDFPREGMIKVMTGELTLEELETLEDEETFTFQTPSQVLNFLQN